MTRIEHRALSAPAPTTARTGHPVPHQFAWLVTGMPLDLPYGGGR